MILDMKAVHMEIFQLLISLREDQDLLFVPRKRNNKKRLENGYFFLGNSGYLHLSFWEGQDSKEKIHNIGFLIYQDGRSFIEISGRDSLKTASFLTLVTNKLGGFDEIKKNKWQRAYSSDDYISNLMQFIEYERKIITAMIRLYKPEGIVNLDENFDNKYVNPLVTKFLPEYKSPQASNVIKNTKKYIVIRNGYEASRYHNELQNKLYSTLKTNSHNQYTQVIMEDNWVDIKAKTQDDEWHFFEIKTDTAKLSIRKAIGQIMEYAYYPTNELANKLFIVSDDEPNKDCIQYLEMIRSKFSIPIYYRWIDIETNILSPCY